MDKKVVIFGPWCGEFSYELQWWIPEIRKVRNDKFSDYYSISIGPGGAKYLYTDFIDEYITYPEEITTTLKYPSTYGEHIAGGGDIIPDNLIEFTHNIINDIKKQYNVEIVELYKPGQLGMSYGRAVSNNPYGEYINYTIDNSVIENMKIKYKDYFKNNNDVVAVSLRKKYRSGELDSETISLNVWIEFLQKLLNDCINIVIMNFKSRDSIGGVFDISSTDFYKNNKNRILILNIFEFDDMIETQFAICKSTKCTIYGVTGAAALPFFVNSPVFTIQTKESGFRLKLDWQLKLTLNHMNVKIFDKYPNKLLKKLNAQEIFTEFKEFYDTII